MTFKTSTAQRKEACTWIFWIVSVGTTTVPGTYQAIDGKSIKKPLEEVKTIVPRNR
jgi:hypothetical protein